MKKTDTKKIIKKKYSQIASDGGCCSCSCDDKNQISKNIGYDEKDIRALPDANLGLGCGNPTAMGNINRGDKVLDLGSGAGFDAFLAAKKVGKGGSVIGVDFSEKMVAKAKENSKKYGFENVRFILGDIENLPVDDHSVDVVISNCVINLAPDKQKVFSEIKRVLKEKGRAYISDIVLLKELSNKQKNDEELLSGCVAGALLKNDYLKIIKSVGLKVRILSEDKEISKKQYQGIALESLKLEITV